MRTKKQGNKTGKTVLIVIAIIAAIFFLFIAAILILATLSDDVEEALDAAVEQQELQEYSAGSKDEEETWTVMLYLCGTDLESDGKTASNDLCDIVNAHRSDNVNVVLQTGGTKKWFCEDYAEYANMPTIDPNSLGFYHIEDDGFKLDKTEPLASMGEESTLRNFVSWSASSYPADRYMLILWDHGGGPTAGVCFDELFEGDSLSISEISQALYDANVWLDVIGFDACLMASLETADAIMDYAHYMVASEEVSFGYAYWDFMDYLEDHPGDDGLGVSKKIVDSYMKKCSDNDMVTMSVVDLTKIEPLSEAYRNYSGELLLLTQDTESFRVVSQEAGRAENYGGNTESEGYTDMVDLGSLIRNTGDELGTNTDAILSTLDEAVVYEKHGSKRSSSEGLSVFYPIEMNDDFLERYSECSDNAAFYEFLTILNGNWDEVDWNSFWESERSRSDYVKAMPDDLYESVKTLEPVRKGNVDVEYSQGFEDEYYRFRITSGKEVICGMNCMLFVIGEDDRTVYLGSDNTVVCDFENGVFTENFNGEWMTIGGEFVYAELSEQADDYNIYTNPVLLNGEEKCMKAIYDYNTYKYSILGVTDGIDEETGQASRGMDEIQKGDLVEFMTFVISPTEDGVSDIEPDMVKLGEITWKDGIEMKDSKFGDVRFLYYFAATDLFGNMYYSDPVVMAVENGNVAVYGDGAYIDSQLTDE